MTLLLPNFSTRYRVHPSTYPAASSTHHAWRYQPCLLTYAEFLRTWPCRAGQRADIQPGSAPRPAASHSTPSPGPPSPQYPVNYRTQHAPPLPTPHEMVPVQRFLDTGALTALSEADVLVQFVDSFIPVARKLCKGQTWSCCTQAACTHSRSEGVGGKALFP